MTDFIYTLNYIENRIRDVSNQKLSEDVYNYLNNLLNDISLPQYNILPNFENNRNEKNDKTKYKSFKNFNKDFNKNFNKQPFEISILAYDAIAYIYHIWQNEKQALSMNSFKLKSKIKGRSGSFFINNDRLLQDLTIYKVSNDSFKKF